MLSCCLLIFVEPSRVPLLFLLRGFAPSREPLPLCVLAASREPSSYGGLDSLMKRSCLLTDRACLRPAIGHRIRVPAVVALFFPDSSIQRQLGQLSVKRMIALDDDLIRGALGNEPDAQLRHSGPPLSAP